MKVVYILNLSFNIIIDAYSIVILALILISSLRQVEKTPLMSRVFNLTIIVTITLFVFDVFSRMDGLDYPYYPFCNTVANFIVFSLNPVVPSLWLIYAHYQLFYDERRTRKLYPTLIALNVANFILVIINQFTGIYYSFAEGNIYQRGPLFFIPFGMTAIQLIISFLLIIINKEKIDKKRYISLLFFAVPPFVCMFLQYFFYGYSLVLCGTVISVIIIYLNIQNQNLYTDYITSLTNRRGLERLLKRKVRDLKPSENFGGLMLDVDHFKAINDTYGHRVGDKALAETAMLLKSAVKNCEMIARFGGDEFFIIVSGTSEEKLKDLVKQINDAFEKRNTIQHHVIPLAVSIGYAIYTKESNQTIEQFHDHLDKLMYENKKSKKIQ